MAARHIDIHGYCDSLYMELSGIKDSLGGFISQIKKMEAKDRTILDSSVSSLESMKEKDFPSGGFAGR